MTKEKAIRTFCIIAKVGVDVSSSRFYKRNNASPSYANSMAIYTVLVLCHFSLPHCDGVAQFSLAQQYNGFLYLHRAFSSRKFSLKPTDALFICRNVKTD
jgi:hypothetical protein